MGWNLVIECSIAAATAAATAATTRESSGWLGRRAVTGAIRRTENRELNRVLLARALRAGNLLRLVQNDLLKVRLAILANVFIYGHFGFLLGSSQSYQPQQTNTLPQKATALRLVGGQLDSAELDRMLSRRRRLPRPSRRSWP